MKKIYLLLIIPFLLAGCGAVVVEEHQADAFFLPPSIDGYEEAVGVSLRERSSSFVYMAKDSAKLGVVSATGAVIGLGVGDSFDFSTFDFLYTKENEEVLLDGFEGKIGCQETYETCQIQVLNGEILIGVEVGHYENHSMYKKEAERILRELINAYALQNI